MARFRSVDFFPSEGFPDRLWGSTAEAPGDPLVDAVLRAARPVVALYSDALTRVEAHGPRAGLSIAVRTAPAADDEVTVDVWRREPEDGPERAFVSLCPTVGHLSGEGRAELALTIVHAAVMELASARSWDRAQLDLCREEVVASSCAYFWQGPWTSSPDRRHRARATYRMDQPDGFGRVRLEVSARSDDRVAASPAAVASCMASRLPHSAATLTWTTSDEVGLTPLVGHGPRGGALTARRDGDGWIFGARDDVAVRAPGGAGIQEDPGAPVPPVVATLV